MIAALEDYPEVLTPAKPLLFQNLRTIYPPQPNADGKFLLSEVLDWDVFMEDVCRVQDIVCGFLWREAVSLPADARRKVHVSIGCIEVISPIFYMRDLRLIPAQQWLKDVCAMHFAQALVEIGHEDCLKMFARDITGSPSKWLSFSRALVENHMRGDKDWRQARSPVKWIRRVTKIIADEEERLSLHAVDPVGEPDTIELEEITDEPIEGLLERKDSPKSIGELEAAASEDPDTAQFLACKIRNPHWSLEDITQQLNWDEKRGKRIDRRYRRLRAVFKKQGLGIQCREYRPPTGISEANFTSYFEELFDGKRGRRMGVWQHRSPNL